MILIISPFASAKENKLVIAVGKDDYITSGPRVNLGRYPLNANIFESLTTFDEQFNLRPCLAASWEYKGNKTWRFHLRKGLKFHDGSPLNAAAVRLSLENQAKAGTLLFDFVKIDDSSKDSIDITTPEENLILPYILSHPYLGIVKPDKNPVGTGAFCFVRYERDQYLEVRKSENYWGEKAKTDRIIFRFVPDNSSRLMSFESGEADILADVPWEAVPSLKQDSQYALHVSPVGTYSGLMLSVTGDLKDKDIRRAVAMSLDRSAINRALWHGYGEIRQTLLAPSFLGEHAELIKDFPYQPEIAKKILNNRKVSLTLVSGFPNANIHGSLPEIIQSQLKNIGIEINIVKVNDIGLYHSMMKEHKGDLWLEKGNSNSADLTFLPHLLFHPKGFYPGQLHTVPGTKQFCQWIEKAGNTQESELFRKYTAMALEDVIHHEILFIPIAELPFMIAVRKNISVPSLYPTMLTMRWGGFAIAAVKKSTFHPPMMNGKPIRARVLLPVKFTLR